MIGPLQSQPAKRLIRSAPATRAATAQIAGFGPIDQVRPCGKKSSGERRRLEVHQGDPACALDPARQGQRGNQHSEDEEGRAPRLVPRA